MKINGRAYWTVDKLESPGAYNRAVGELLATANRRAARLDRGGLLAVMETLVESSRYTRVDRDYAVVYDKAQLCLGVLLACVAAQHHEWGGCLRLLDGLARLLRALDRRDRAELGRQLGRSEVRLDLLQVLAYAKAWADEEHRDTVMTPEEVLLQYRSISRRVWDSLGTVSRSPAARQAWVERLLLTGVNVLKLVTRWIPHEVPSVIREINTGPASVRLFAQPGYYDQRTPVLDGLPTDYLVADYELYKAWSSMQWSDRWGRCDLTRDDLDYLHGLREQAYRRYSADEKDPGNADALNLGQLMAWENEYRVMHPSLARRFETVEFRRA